MFIPLRDGDFLTIFKTNADDPQAACNLEGSGRRAICRIQAEETNAVEDFAFGISAREYS
jgi:hypothetical protein